MSVEPKWGGVTLGWKSTKSVRQKMGLCSDKFALQHDEEKAGLPVLDESDGHILCVAPTGAGKGRGLVIPTLLSYHGSMVVLDIKGEAARVTAQRRRDMGQKVYILDPFKELDKGHHAFNPLDTVLSRDQGAIEDAALMFAKMVAGGERSAREPFWEDQADDLNAGILTHVMSSRKKTDRTFAAAHEILMSDDTDYRLACMLDNDEVKSGFARRNIAAYLSLPERETRPSVLGTARQRMRTFSSKAARTSTRRTSFSVDDLKEGKPMTIYLVVPIHKLDSHKGLLRLWLSAFINIMTMRKVRPEKPTLFVIDEMAQLGHMPQFQQISTLLRGYGMRAIMILQSLSQFRYLFPEDPDTMIQNCGTILTFGHRAYTLSQDMARVLGDIGEDALFEMDDGDTAVKTGKNRTQILRRPDYLEDDIFQGHYAKNTMLGR